MTNRLTPQPIKFTSVVYIKMAEDTEEYFQLLEEIDEKQLMVLQAYIRGTLTRKWLKELRIEYQQISQAIERKDVNIEWPSEQPCLPKILNKRQRKTPKFSEKTKDFKLSVEIQTDFDRNDNQLNIVSGLGSGTPSDPVVINDSLLDANDQTHLKHGRLNSLDSIPVRDSDSSHGTDTGNSVEEKKERKENDQVPTCESVPKITEGTSMKEVSRSEQSVVCDVTSVWDAELSSFATEEMRLPTEKGELKELRKNLAMELLWIQQAIQSRKNYLRLKNQMGS